MSVLFGTCPTHGISLGRVSVVRVATLVCASSNKSRYILHVHIMIIDIMYNVYGVKYIKYYKIKFI